MSSIFLKKIGYVYYQVMVVNPKLRKIVCNFQNLEGGQIFPWKLMLGPFFCLLSLHLFLYIVSFLSFSYHVIFFPFPSPLPFHFISPNLIFIRLVAAGSFVL